MKTFNTVDIEQTKKFAKPTLEELKGMCSLPDYVMEDYIFTHLVITDAVYVHPWYGIVRYSLDDLKNMKDNHNNKVYKEDIFVKAGHANYDGSAQALAWYISGTAEIIKLVNETDEIRYALIVSGYYTEEGYQKINNKTYKYLSAEIDSNYREREVSGLGVNTGDVKENEKSNQLSYGTTLVGVAFTNSPFYHGTDIDVSDDYDVVEFSNCNEMEFFCDHNGKAYAKHGQSRVAIDKAPVEAVEAFNNKRIELDTIAYFDLNMYEVYADKQSTDQPPNEHTANAIESEFMMNKKWFTMTSAELSKTDRVGLTDDELSVFNQAVEFANMRDNEQRLRESNRQFQAALEEKDAKIVELSNIANTVKSDNYAMKVSKFSDDLHSAGIPTAVVDNATELLNAYDPVNREAAFIFSNVAKGINEEMTIFEYTKKLFSAFTSDMFRSATTAAAVETEEAAVEVPATETKQTKKGSDYISEFTNLTLGK